MVPLTSNQENIGSIPVGEATIVRTINIENIRDLPEDYTGIVEYPLEKKEWYSKGKLHRADGPAVEYAGGFKVWHLNGERHREDGPAREYINGKKEWWINNQFILQLEEEDQPFLILEEAETQLKILTATEIKWVPIVPGLKELEGKPCK